MDCCFACFLYDYRVCVYDRFCHRNRKSPDGSPYDTVYGATDGSAHGSSYAAAHDASHRAAYGTSHDGPYRGPYGSSYRASRDLRQLRRRHDLEL